MPSVKPIEDSRRTEKGFLPLFITSCSLSSVSAIGVQTKLFLGQFPEWRHLYWEPLDYQIDGRHSTRAESLFYSWFNLMRSQVAHSRSGRSVIGSQTQESSPKPVLTLPKTGASWWESGTLKPRYEARIQKQFRNAVSVIYVAPLGIRDCERMKALLLSLDKPFVVHLWDLLDSDQLNSSAFRWLLINAAHVLCLSEPMIDYIRPLRSDATILRFIRKPSSFVSLPPKQGPIRIALLGTHKKQQSGLILLRNTLSVLRERKIPVEVVQIGLRKRLRYWGPDLPPEVRATGFLRSDDTRDQVLAQCHFGFLPGPLSSPDQDSYSRFSIPSRVLDYMATGLPVIATVHPESATAVYLRAMGLESSIIGESAEKFADKLVAMSRHEAWLTCSGKSRAAFDICQHEKNDLKYWLDMADSRSRKQTASEGSLASYGGLHPEIPQN